jgi:hypothetical protein
MSCHIACLVLPLLKQQRGNIMLAPKVIREWHKTEAYKGLAEKLKSVETREELEAWNSEALAAGCPQMGLQSAEIWEKRGFFK